MSFQELICLSVDTLVSEWTVESECNSTTVIDSGCNLPVSIVLRVAAQIVVGVVGVIVVVVVVVVAWIGAISGPW